MIKTNAHKTIKEITMTKSTKQQIQKENDYYADLEKESENRTKYANKYDGSFYASKGDYEGACLARAEFEAGYIS